MSTALLGCYVISLRPVGGHGAIRRAAATRGARVVALSPWRLVPRNDDASRARLQRALAAGHVVFTSPAAVGAADALVPLRSATHGAVIAVGGGTARALRRAGITHVEVPERMESEGLLALPALQSVAGARVGLVTAPGGRGLIAATLRARGADVRRADVYERIATSPSSAALDRLRTIDATMLLLLSSGEAFESLLSRLPAALLPKLRAARVVAASARLQDIARGHGFAHVVRAPNALPAAMLDAAAGACQQARATTSAPPGPRP